MCYMKVKDLTECSFGRLTVLERAENSKQGQAQWRCRCSCGKEIIALGSNLRRGKTFSCGCYRDEKAKERLSSHKQSNTRLYRIYNNMKNRCYYSKNDNYKWYGARGIGVCKEWKESFQAFYAWAMSSGYADNLTLDRKDRDLDYSPDNCRWITIQRQQNNRCDNVRIEFRNKSLTLSEWSRITGINRVTLWNRIFTSKWSIEKALTTKASKEFCSGANKDSQESLESKSISGGRHEGQYCSASEDRRKSV